LTTPCSLVLGHFFAVGYNPVKSFSTIEVLPSSMWSSQNPEEPVNCQCGLTIGASLLPFHYDFKNEMLVSVITGFPQRNDISNCDL
jgi:hypothetical protein